MGNMYRRETLKTMRKLKNNLMITSLLVFVCYNFNTFSCVTMRVYAYICFIYIVSVYLGIILFNLVLDLHICLFLRVRHKCLL